MYKQQRLARGSMTCAAHATAGGRMDGFGGGPMGPPMMRDEGPDGMLGRGDHGPPIMHHSLPGDDAVL